MRRGATTRAAALRAPRRDRGRGRARARHAGPLRGARGVAVASVAALITGVAHVAGGGALPDLGLLLVLFPLLAALIVSIADACRSIGGVLGALAAGQLGMHAVLEVIGHSHVAGAAGPASGWSMFAMHAVATIVLGLLVRDADQVLGLLVSALARVLPRRLTVPPADRPLATLAVAGPAVVGATERAALGPRTPRGPPNRV
ncbi:hypothetical protein PSU4_50340 [Pseudonocardia sulfidoxydans NBRC 16205]|uniref:Uncharacterized protein n=1 Tax=Pseudonocardia sulfidoxydans NBRC 16205 TaxID=1223511 RepID=A0A511DMP2_9PSEU|nr:hypothetical protein [Pseudonocardia sulfidoxydans]GEL26080.1 hypothetical protein PSU4_50340 [Pseudonocardia sulfidoxydans NBRC 16205]